MTRKQRKRARKNKTVFVKRNSELDELAFGLAKALTLAPHPWRQYDQDTFIDQYGKKGCIVTRGGYISDLFRYCDKCWYNQRPEKENGLEWVGCQKRQNTKWFLQKEEIWWQSKLTATHLQ